MGETAARLHVGVVGVLLMLLGPAVFGLALTGGEDAPAWLQAVVRGTGCIVALVTTLTGAWTTALAFLGKPRREDGGGNE